MAVIKELIRSEVDGTISFGDYTLDKKAKLQDFEHQGDLYKVKTYHEITKLERNGMFVYESVPGTAVNHMNVTESGVQFYVEGAEDAQITVELAEDTEYKIFIDDTNVGKMKTNLSGKLALSVELSKDDQSHVKIIKL
ncbi:endosialidase [Candidatus Galacturonibacter soehngenii]|uniref:Endosialidase n=1 Tax=Candidatus Galacturonatibacter soehngenii TaxID=2307010 RepID=A0A7V7QP60_9FIRM|nr:endosialidase [Candidatus Galacturonibacter soehngenii]KAB1441049.1 endosialidase [Candidatus Galacturonibacter soehngenii]MBA4688380.1 endosialidase [Candidatus Galacturonibacter soehngenii]